MSDEQNSQTEDQQFSILRKSIIPNLLSDDFNTLNKDELEENHEPTFLTEVSDEEADLRTEEELQNTLSVHDQEKKRNCFKDDFDFRKTLVNEESFENMKETEPNEEIKTDHLTEQPQHIKQNMPVIDIFAAVGAVAVVIELLFFMM